jgi:uncharacterized protein with WD repeat
MLYQKKSSTQLLFLASTFFAQPLLAPPKEALPAKLPTRLLATLSHGYGSASPAWSPSGEHLAIAHEGQVQGPPGFLFSGNGKKVEVAVKVLSVTGEVVATLTHEGTIRKITWSPGSEFLAICSDDKTKIWTVRGHAVVTLQNGDSLSSTAAWAPTGERLAIAYNSRWRPGKENKSEVKLWAPTGDSVATLPHSAGVVEVVWSPSGRCLATASTDHTAKLWTDDGEFIVALLHETGSA